MLKKIEHCNVEAMLAVKARILAEPENLDMANYACGTTRCIAGWAVHLAGGDPENEKAHFQATDILGLDRQVADDLFLVRNVSGLACLVSLTDVTAKQAARAIDNVVATNNPGWNEVLSGE